jgi:hypothetical protein
MALVVKDRVKETTTTTGTGTVTLSGASTGFQTFDSAIGTSNTTYYCIAGQGTSEWEVGLGTLATSTTLARTTVYASSNAGSLVTFSAGTKDVFVTFPANQVINPGTSGNVLVSNGTVWQSTTLTATQVSSAYAGLTAGAVGTMALARSSVAAVFGATVAGSNLYPSNTLGEQYTAGGTLSGTWRCLGYTVADNKNPTREVSLFVRTV